MSRDLDLKKIDVVDYLTKLGIRNMSSAANGEVMFSCPFPGHSHGDENASACMNTGDDDKSKTTLFICYGCKRKGNAVTFLAELENISRLDAAQFIREEYDAGFKEPAMGEYLREWEDHIAEREPAEPEDVTPVLDESVLDKFYVKWYGDEEQDSKPLNYMVNERGFRIPDLIRWKIGWDSITERITIPVHDPAGALIGFNGRTPYPDIHPRYLCIGDRPNKDWYPYGFEPYQKTATLFGLHEVDPTGRLVLVEGELNVIAMHEKHGITDCVGLGGSYFSQRQRELVRWHADEVVVFFDSLKYAPEGEIGPQVLYDKAGIQATASVIEELEPYMPVKVVDYHLLDPADMKTNTVHKLIEGAVGSVSLSLPF